MMTRIHLVAVYCAANEKVAPFEEDLRELYWVRAGDLYLSSLVDGLARRKGGRDHFLKRLGGHWGLHSLHQLLGTEISQATEQDCQQD
jgi:hypothetical protein